jgi:transcriptional regulator with XRE-family HTH domain
MPRATFSTEYGKLVRLLVQTRKSQGLTQEVVAQRLGKPQSYVAKIERGERRVDLLDFVRLADAMSVDATDLFKQFVAATR